MPVAFPLRVGPLLAAELGRFAVLGAVTITSTGATALVGDLGTSPKTAITGYGPGTCSGRMHSGGPVAAQVRIGDVMTNLARLGRGTQPDGILNGLTLAPGVCTVVALARTCPWS